MSEEGSLGDKTPNFHSSRTKRPFFEIIADSEPPREGLYGRGSLDEFWPFLAINGVFEDSRRFGAFLDQFQLKMTRFDWDMAI